MGLVGIFFWGLFCVFLAGASGSAGLGWFFFIGTIVGLFVIKDERRRKERNRQEAAQTKFIDLGQDTRFEWPDDAGWLGKAVGTSHYQAALDRLNSKPGSTIETTLLLVPEPNNPRDENAIAVCTEAGLLLGHIASQDNTAYLRKLRAATGGRKRVATTRARVGCFIDEETGNRMHFIRLVPNDY